MSNPIKKLLGVMTEDGPINGSHFNKLFDGRYKSIQNVKDVTPDVGAIIFWGGTDISPALYKRKPNMYNEAASLPSKRDQIEWAVMREAHTNDIPMIGVCRGAQLMCAYAGGELYQHVPGHSHNRHSVDVRGVTYYDVAADHHQMMCPPPDAVVLGWATTKQASGYYNEDSAYQSFPVGFKEPEIVFFPDIKGIGFQPHPEWCSDMHPFVKICLDLCKEKLCL